MPPELVRPLAVTVVLYVVAMAGLGLVARRRIDTVEDFVVAGRRLPLLLAVPTLLATWFGAGTLLAVADEVRARGVVAAALDPIGAGACLLLAGALFARKLWRLRLITLADLFARRFGRRVELAVALIQAPGYIGWIAAQFAALGAMLELLFNVPLPAGMALVALVGVGYTLLGGMWAVTLTDAVQAALLLVGLLATAAVVLVRLGGSLGGGYAALVAATPAERLVWVPTETLSAFVGWLGVFCAGALGNIPSQDLMQRIFAARGEGVARRACYVAGGLYLSFGMIPVLLGLAGNVLGGARGRATLPMLAALLLHPALAILFVLMVMSAVLSTIDSAVLAPATVLAHNVLSKEATTPEALLRRNRGCVLAVGLLSLAVAYFGESAYGLLESSYELTMVSLLVPLVCALHLPRPSGRGVVAAMAAGTAAWGVHRGLGLTTFFALQRPPLPVGLLCTAVGGVAYAAVAWLAPGARAEPLVNE